MWCDTGCAKQAHAGPHEGEAGRLATQVSNLSEQLHAAQAATAAAQQESNHLRHKQQVHNDVPGMNCKFCVCCRVLPAIHASWYSQSMAVSA
jgi:outer membrane murein-binding lipoprotein Lpp